MSDLRTLVLLDEIIEAADRVATLVAEAGSEAVPADWRTYDALCLSLIRIGEGVNALTDDARSALNLPNWRDVVSLRNRIAHGYPTLAKARVWEIARKDVARMQAAARRLRDHLERP